MFYVYILRCADGSFYVGHTADLPSRVQVHKDGNGAEWTSRRRPVVLVYSELAADEVAAIRREVQIKGWTHAKKLALISGDLQRPKSLAKRRKR